MALPRWVEKFFYGVHTSRETGNIAVRQIAELKKQVSSLYMLLIVNACALSYTHYPLAPAWLTVGVPVTLSVLCIARAIHWGRLHPESFTEQQAVRHLRITSFLTIILSAGFVTWAMALDGYGGPFEQGHVGIFVAITVVACIFCLTHLPVAAFLVTAIVMSVFLFRCIMSGNSVYAAVALNTAFVTIVMVRVLTSNFLAFIQLVDSQAEAQRLAEENAHLAHTDSLTGLPNRRFFFQQVEAELRSAGREETPFALAIFDLDRFKPINDTFGHNAGDRVLVETGARLAAFAGSEVTVTRLGGDEFGVLVRSPMTSAEALAFCNRICAALQAPIRFGEAQVFTGCSGGLALYPCAGRNADELFDRADYALYHSKEQQRGLTTLFSCELEQAIRSERAVETALRSADLNSEMELHYQPILDTKTNTISLVEGLARWTSPTLGHVPPDRFILAAERCGMIHSITLVLLRKALADTARLPQTIGVSFNLSSHDLTCSETVLAILTTIRESGITPRRITLELTETALMRDFERAKASIAMLRALGTRIALDDFGTGYSSLSYVHRLPLDKIKIDRSFMSDIESSSGKSIVSTIVDLCQNLGLCCVAEGVETLRQLEAVRQYGCRYVQGYLVGAPMPIDVLVEKFDHAALIEADQRIA